MAGKFTWFAYRHYWSDLNMGMEVRGGGVGGGGGGGRMGGVRAGVCRKHVLRQQERYRRVLRCPACVPSYLPACAQPLQERMRSYFAIMDIGSPLPARLARRFGVGRLVCGMQ